MCPSFVNRFVVQHQGVAFDVKQYEPLGQTFGLLSQQRVFAVERLGPVDGERKPCFQRGDIRSDFVAPMFEAFFDAAPIQRQVTHRFGAHISQRFKQGRGGGVGNGQFPAIFADKADPGGA